MKLIFSIELNNCTNNIVIEEMMTECTVEMGTIERPTRFQVNPVGSGGDSVNGTQLNGGDSKIDDSKNGGSHEIYRRIPEIDIEASEYDTFPEDAANIVLRRQSR